MERDHLRRLALTATLTLAGCGEVVTGAVGDAAPQADRVAEAGCQSNEDCDDGFQCTADRCEVGVCRNAAIDSRCSDGLRCDPAMGCADPRCGLGRRLCEQSDGPRACVDVLFDENNCGDCDQRCVPGERCVQGACQRRIGVIGDRCREDSFCVEGLVCESTLDGVCSRACPNNQLGQAAEAMACGDAQATCLAVGGVPGPGQCVRRCDPRATTVVDGACGAAFVCTGLWLSQRQGLPDGAGCVRFCSNDEACAGDVRGAVCNVRTGQCGTAGADERRLADGSACDPDALEDVCRGQCLRVSGGRGGLCGSYLNRLQTRGCYDDPDRMVLQGPVGADNLALCLYRRCVDNCDCTGGLVCVYLKDPTGMPVPAPTGLCTYPSPRQPQGTPRAGGCGGG